MSEFTYVYREARIPTAQEQQARMHAFLAWFKDLEAKGHMKDYGHALERTGGGTVRDAKGTVTDGPYAKTKDIVIGFSVVVAKDFAEAVKFASACPLVLAGGLIEVRPMLKM